MNLDIAEFFAVNQIDVTFASAFPNFRYESFTLDHFEQFCQFFFPRNTVFQPSIIEQMYCIISNSITLPEYDDNDVSEQIRKYFVYWSRLFRAGPLRKCKIFVDLQNDFVTGSLAMPFQDCANGSRFDKLYCDLYHSLCTSNNNNNDLVVLTRDWHPDTHVSFFKNCHLYRSFQRPKQPKPQLYNIYSLTTPYSDKYDQLLWPTHCVQYSAGADFTPRVRSILAESRKLFPYVRPYANSTSHIYTDDNKYIVIDKGTDKYVESYSAFFDDLKIHRTELLDQLLTTNVYNVEVYGVCLEFCVRCTAEDAAKLGFSTTIIESACPAMRPQPEEINDIVNELKSIKINVLREE